MRKQRFSTRPFLWLLWRCTWSFASMRRFAQVWTWSDRAPVPLAIRAFWFWIRNPGFFLRVRRLRFLQSVGRTEIQL